jgi:AmiR/NasT family two-component response regulator
MGIAEAGAVIDLAEQLEERAAELEQALEDRILFERAKQAVALRYGLEGGEAREMIYALARSESRDLYSLCEDIVTAGGTLDGLCRDTPLRLRT